LISNFPHLFAKEKAYIKTRNHPGRKSQSQLINTVSLQI